MRLASVDVNAVQLGTALALALDLSEFFLIGSALME
jgi:hypothetical protein